MSEVVDLNQRRMDKALGQAPAGCTVVSLIGCANCRGTAFHLTHDKFVLCAGCNNLIEGCFWWTPSDPRTAA